MSLETVAHRQAQRHSHPAPTVERERAFDPASPAALRALDGRGPGSSPGNETAGVPPTTVDVAIAWRFVAGAIAVLAGGIGLAAIIALKTTIYLSRFNYH
jgi:hypothetical protein